MASGGKFVPKSNFLLITTSNSSGKDYNFSVYDIAQDSVILSEKRFLCNENDYNITAIGTSPDGNYFALACYYIDNQDIERSGLLLYDAHTFEFINFMFYDIFGITEEIAFSKNSKWICSYRWGWVDMVDLEQYFYDHTKILTTYQSVGNLKFAGDENTIFLGDYAKKRKILYRLHEKDTIYYVNQSTVGFVDYDPNTNNWLHNVGLKLYMYNHNMHNLDVPNAPTESPLITQVTYQDGLLSFTTAEIEIQNITITDATGKTVYTNQYNANNQINISLSNGVYFLTLHDGENSYSKKFVAEN